MWLALVTWWLEAFLHGVNNNQEATLYCKHRRHKISLPTLHWHIYVIYVAFIVTVYIVFVPVLYFFIITIFRRLVA